MKIAVLTPDEVRKDQLIRDRLTTVYLSESSKLDPVLHRMQIASLEPEKW